MEKEFEVRYQKRGDKSGETFKKRLKSESIVAARMEFSEKFNKERAYIVLGCRDITGEPITLEVKDISQKSGGHIG